MAVTPADPAVLVVNSQFGSLVSAHFTAAIHSITFGLVMAADAAGAASLDVPSPVRVRDHMMTVGSSAHSLALPMVVYRYEKFAVPNKTFAH
jgi:hypothetical protein